MMRQLFVTTATVLFLLACKSIVFGQSSHKVAFRTVAGEPSRYITFPGDCGAGLNSGAQKISANTIFTLIDLNGGDFEDGDSVRIKCGKKYWRANGGVDLEEGLPDKFTIFTIERENKFIRLKTHGGGYVIAPALDGSVSVSEKDEDRRWSVLDMIFDPK